MNTTSATEERLWTVLSHLSALAFGMGIALPVVGWSDQRRKSNYASFQCLQALGYQSLGFTVWILSYLVVILGSIVLFVLLGPEGGDVENVDAVLAPWSIGLIVVLVGGLVMYLFFPLLGAVACALGRDFRYPILGHRLALYLGYNELQKSDDEAWLHEDHEFHWVAAMGHFSILILLWGMLAPLTAWIVQGKHSSFLRFQSIQTLLYQGMTTVLFFLALFLYLFSFLILLTGLGLLGEIDLNSPSAIVGIGVMGVFAFLSILLLLLLPFLHILGQWAGYRVLKRDDYRYPLIGRLVKRWMTKSS